VGGRRADAALRTAHTPSDFSNFEMELASRRAHVHLVAVPLNGEKPANLPVIRATKVELVSNNSSARAPPLTIPQSILLRADEIIE
jgi:hypothetical protein